MEKNGLSMQALFHQRIIEKIVKRVTMDNIKYISKEIWFEHAKQYIIEYIAHHKVYRWIKV